MHTLLVRDSPIGRKSGEIGRRDSYGRAGPDGVGAVVNTPARSGPRFSVEAIVGDRLINSVYQPIVDLDTRCVVAYEALARGPVGTELESPDQLFAAAARRGLTSALDWMCRAAALEGAMSAGMGRHARLFVNVEPSTFRTERPAEYDALWKRADSTLDVVIEVTERALIGDPAALIAALTSIRALGMGVAIDDVGADPASLALLPFVEPDVIKLDLRLVQRHTDPEIASISIAVRADAERRGATILAEGIETNEHLERALVLGAHLGQGWLFGRPGPLPTFGSTVGHVDSLRAVSIPVPVTPWSLVSGWPQRRTTTKRLLVPMSNYVEQRAASVEPCVLLSAFQDARHFTAATMRRYDELVPHRSLVGAIGRGMPRRPTPGVRGGSLPSGHPLTDEWTVTVVGPHEAVALIAKDYGDAGAESERRFEYVITHDRPTVVAAARSLMQYIDAQ